ncbi:MAG: VOC family protein [Cellulomonas sp.]|uniref:VOC family protein n=1 Tax=Cellulomonas sp. TaxID=40001 RepID=UPI001A08459C|nr:VOC family protein [Cellulomonas sp.]MBF0687933.1 VOC family protein [Cellulomonas sp.]
MAIRSILINVTDVRRSVDFYRRHLGVEVLEQSDEAAVLDAVTATLRLERLDPARAEESTFVSDDLQRGFRHIGFKVADIDARAAALREADVPFHLEPLNAEGDVRLTFFYDPDGTMVELVEGPLQYHEVYDRELVDADWALGTPSRPRFDHVGETVADLGVTQEYYGALGYRLMAGIHQPGDSRGFEIAFLRDGDSSLEIFTFERGEKTTREPQLGGPGFAAVVLDGDAAPVGATPVGTAFGTALVADPDGLVHGVVQA